MAQRWIRMFFVFVLAGLLCSSRLASPQEVKQATPVFAAIYSRGPAWVESKSPFEQTGIREHIQHFQNLGDRLIAAAPFRVDPTDRAVGMVLLFADSEQSARDWAAADPAVLAKVMEVKLYPWRISNLRGCFERKQ